MRCSDKQRAICTQTYTGRSGRLKSQAIGPSRQVSDEQWRSEVSSGFHCYGPCPELVGNLRVTHLVGVPSGDTLLSEIPLELMLTLTGFTYPPEQYSNTPPLLFSHKIILS